MPTFKRSAPVYFQKAFSAAEFQTRRLKIMEEMGTGVAVLQGAAATGAMEILRQHNDFFYLCGVETPHSYLVLDARSKKSKLYLPHCEPRMREVEGPELNYEDADTARRLTGVDEVSPLAALATDIRTANLLYVCRQAAEGGQACQDSINEARRLADEDPWRRHTYQEHTFADLLAHRVGPVELRDLSPILIEMRRLKSEREIEVLRECGKITALALIEAMRCTQVGMLERQLAAVADYVFRLNGAPGGGYRPTVASGANIWNMHYFRNSSPMADGDLVLMDYAPDYAYYTSDIGRMWPINGKYSHWQRELYGFVVDYHQTLLELIEPGKTPRQLREEAGTKLTPIAKRTNWGSPWFGDAIEKLLATSRAMTHDVGMTVHERCGYQDDERELEPGLVFALDPQLWVNEDRRYIRVEDNVLITEKGVESLTQQAPLDLDEVEKTMRKEGILQARPELLINGNN